MSKFIWLLIVNFAGTASLIGIPDSVVLRLISGVGFFITVIIILRRLSYSSDAAYFAQENWKWKFIAVYVIAIGLFIFAVLATIAMVNLGIPR